MYVHSRGCVLWIGRESDECGDVVPVRKMCTAVFRDINEVPHYGEGVVRSAGFGELDCEIVVGSSKVSKVGGESVVFVIAV